MKIEDIEEGQLYKVTFTEKMFPGLYDNAVYPHRIKIIEGESNFCIAIFNGYSTHQKVPIWAIVIAPWELKIVSGLGTNILAVSAEKIKEIESFNKNDLPLYINEYKTSLYTQILKKDI